MKLLMPFWNLDILPRYMPQFTALAKHVDRLTILYLNGTPIPHTHIIYRKIDLPKALNKQHQMLRLMDTINEQAEDIAFDVVYSLSGRWLQIAASNISTQTGTPLVLRLRGDERGVLRIRGRRRIYRTFFREPMRKSLRQASLVIPIAEKLVTVARRLGAKNVTNPIPNGVDHNKFQPTPQPDSPTVGYVGRLSVEKGVEFLQSLVQSTPNIHYIIAGDMQCRFNPLMNCDLLGPVPYSRIQDIYKTSSIVIIPSLIEGYPNALLEAYASSRPVIITPEAHPREANLYGWKLPQGDGWQQVLNHLRQKRLKPLGREAHEYSQQFTWERHGEQMAAAISSIEDNPSKPSLKHPVHQATPQPP